VLTGVVALLLAIGSAAPGAMLGLPMLGPPLPAAPLLQQAGAPSVSVSMTTVNDGHVVSLLDPTQTVWVHPAPTGAVAEVTATVDLHGSSVHQWVAHLDTPDSFQGVTPGDCHGSEEAPPRQVSCRFAVQAASGPNRLLFHFTADDGRVDVEADGTITGGRFDWDAYWQVLDATGRWRSIGQPGSISLPATVPSAVRYVVANTGEIPFRATNGCDDRLLKAHSRLVCLVHGVRPGQSLAHDYHEQLRLVDVVGATAEPDFRVSIRSIAGTPARPPGVDAGAFAWPWLTVPALLLACVAAIVALRVRDRRRLAPRLDSQRGRRRRSSAAG
jgi:hypothetical protein